MAAVSDRGELDVILRRTQTPHYQARRLYLNAAGLSDIPEPPPPLSRYSREIFADPNIALWRRSVLASGSARVARVMDDCIPSGF